jgi:hypothetical protein
LKLTYLLLVLSLGITNISYSQELKDTIEAELPCYDTKELFKSLKEKYKEMPLLTGKATDEARSTLSVWMNPLDKNWTIVATTLDISCIVGMGTDIKVLNYKIGTGI